MQTQSSVGVREPWKERFREVYERAVAVYGQGGYSPAACVSAPDRDFLATIGATAQEVFDYAEDWCRSAAPTFEEVLAVTAIRRDYFLNVQQGKGTGQVRRMADFPAKTDAVDGIAWLPRLIVKAKARLRGELPDELMYGCGGDRPFLQGVRVGLAEFLEVVRDSNGDDRAVVEFVKRRSRGA